MSIGIVPCQGTSNTGVMTTKAAIDCVERTSAKMVCPLGLPLGIEGIIKNAQKHDQQIALNGCHIKCSSKTLESIGVTEYKDITLTSDFDIRKNGEFHDETGLKTIRQALRDTVRAMETE